ncbi:hypothetical protein PPHE_a0526 [Pseudoalteromonas phenolica O-BC30]|nr:hypothetical protein [Pseudoalteromonas phenolica O-BC30]
MVHIQPFRAINLQKNFNDNFFAKKVLTSLEHISIIRPAPAMVTH